MKACVKCGAEIKDGARFCPSCGTKQALVCPQCGKELENPDAKFCPNCGASLAQAEGNRPEQYYYEERGTIQDPVPAAEIKRMIAEGKLGYGDKVLRRGSKEWTRLEESEFSSLLTDKAPKPLDADKVSDWAYWTLAFAPIIGLFMSYAAAYMSLDTENALALTAKAQNYWWITVCVNVLLCIIDSQKLKNAGYDIDKYLWAIILVPVYIYKRAQLVGQSQGCLVVWFICLGCTFMPSLY